MGPVAAPTDHVSRDPPVLERALVHPQVGGGAGQQHHVARGGPVGEQPPDARRERARLGHPPRSAEALHRPVGALVGDQQFDQRTALARRRVRPAGPERAELVAELSLEHPVDHLEDLGAGAEVGIQRLAFADGGQPLAALLEQLDVGVAEAVDRLLGVADREQVPVRDQLDQLELHLVGVLELVDHDPGKARPVPLAERRIGAQQLAALELEVLEVEPRNFALGTRVVLAEQAQQPVEQVVRPGGPAVLHGAPERGKRFGVARANVGAEGRAVAAGQRDPPQIAGPGILCATDHVGEPLEPPDRLNHLGSGIEDRRQLRERDRAGTEQLLARRPELRRRRHRRQPRPPLAARSQLVVHLGDRTAQGAGAVGGDQVDRAWGASR